MKLSVVGLGKLGACSAACFAAKGFSVLGVDINKKPVDAINSGIAPVYEPRLQELISAAKRRFKATQDYEMAIKESDITFLVVPTPSKEDGNFSDEYLRDALKHLSVALKNSNKKYHLFVITSTVTPGTTEEELIPLIESVSGKKINKDFGVCYNPEFIALGSVINDFLHPDMVLIGESDKPAGVMLEKVYKKVCENKPYLARMSIINAEITKISLNSFITLKISFANTLSNICENTRGADIDVITKALGADRRIAPYYLKGGLSFGGPCFPRDNKAFTVFAAKYGVDTKIAKATDEINQIQIERVVKIILSHMPTESRNAISILGLSYKPKTNVIEESPGVKIIENLLKIRKAEIIVYDPLAMDNARAHFGDTIRYASSIKDCFVGSSLCVIATQDEQFKVIDESFIVKVPTTIIDCWRILDAGKFKDKTSYITLGRN